MSSAILTEEEHEAVADTIRRAEAQTSGEIFAVVARRSDDYFYVAGFFALLWIAAFGPVAALVLWIAGERSYPVEVFIFQALSLAALLLVFRLRPDWRLAFVPRSVAYRRASRNAVDQFLAHGIDQTVGRTGVLLFVSLAERYAEVVADREIDEKVPQQAWNDLIAILVSHAASDQLADGFKKAIKETGLILAEHAPPREKNENELEDKLVEL